MASQSKNLQVGHVDGTAVVRLMASNIDSSNLNEIATELTDHAAQQGLKGMVLNLENVEFLYSDSLALLVSVHKSLQRRGLPFRLCHVRPAILDLMVVTQLDRHLDIRDTESAALETL